MEEKKAEVDEFHQLRSLGYQVIDAPVLTAEECEHAKSGLWDWLESLDRGLDRNRPETWTSAAWPSNVHGIVQFPSAAHTIPVWEIRTKEKILDVFAKLWKCEMDNLQVSFDRICIQRPVTNRQPSQKTWLHLDQGSRLRGERCFQGFVTLADMPAEGGTLVVTPDSHKWHDQFFKDFPERICKKHPKTGKMQYFHDNWVKFNQEELDWWAKKGCEPIRVSAKAGQLVLWDSRACHQGSHPLPDQLPQWRWVVYVCYKPTPKAQDKASQKKLDKVLGKKRKAFEDGRTTSHWSVPEPYTKRSKSGKTSQEWVAPKIFPIKPQFSQNQKPEPETSLKVRTVEELALISPRGPRLAGFRN